MRGRLPDDRERPLSDSDAVRSQWLYFVGQRTESGGSLHSGAVVCLLISGERGGPDWSPSSPYRGMTGAGRDVRHTTRRGTFDTPPKPTVNCQAGAIQNERP